MSDNSVNQFLCLAEMQTPFTAVHNSVTGELARIAWQEIAPVPESHGLLFTSQSYWYWQHPEEGWMRSPQGERSKPQPLAEMLDFMQNWQGIKVAGINDLPDLPYVLSMRSRPTVSELLPRYGLICDHHGAIHSLDALDRVHMPASLLAIADAQPLLKSQAQLQAELPKAVVPVPVANAPSLPDLPANLQPVRWRSLPHAVWHNRSLYEQSLFDQGEMEPVSRLKGCDIIRLGSRRAARFYGIADMFMQDEASSLFVIRHTGLVQKRYYIAQFSGSGTTFTKIQHPLFGQKAPERTAIAAEEIWPDFTEKTDPPILLGFDLCLAVLKDSRDKGYFPDLDPLIPSNAQLASAIRNGGENIGKQADRVSDEISISARFQVSEGGRCRASIITHLPPLLPRLHKTETKGLLPVLQRCISDAKKFEEVVPIMQVLHEAPRLHSDVQESALGIAQALVDKNWAWQRVAEILCGIYDNLSPNVEIIADQLIAGIWLEGNDVTRKGVETAIEASTKRAPSLRGNVQQALQELGSDLSLPQLDQTPTAPQPRESGTNWIRLINNQLVRF